MIELICYNIIFLGLLYLIYVLLLKKEKNLKLNRTFLLLSLFLCFASPFLQFDYGLDWSHVNQIVTTNETVNDTFSPSNSPFENLEVIEYQSNIVYSTITIGYFTVVLLMFLRLLWNLKKIYSTIKNSKKVNYKGQYLILTEDTNSPYSFLKHIFISPKHLENETELEPILAHENCHSRQYHTLDILIIELIMCFAWFNPFIWLFKKEMETNHEFLADSFVINTGVNINFYSTLLVNQSQNNFSEIYSGFSLIRVKNRLNMLHQQKSSIVKNIIKVSAAFILCAGVFILSSSSTAKENKEFVVVVDPGHGGKDAGYLNEKDINLEIANQLLELSESSNIKVISTRSADDFISLDDRVKLINKIKPDLLLSLHCNSSENTQTKGLEGYYSTENDFEEISKSFVEILVQKQLATENSNGNIKSANFVILKNSKVPSVLLELGFLTNKDDLKRLRDKEQQKIIANRILNGLKQISATVR